MVWTPEIPDEPETDDPASSSENESLSNSDDDRHATSTISQARAPVSGFTRYRTVVSSGDGTVSGKPRKFLKARQANLDAWQYVTAIVGVDGATTPWEGLLQAIQDLHKSSNDLKVMQYSALGRSTAVLWSVIRRRLMVLIDTSEKYRSYSKTLSRTEAKALTRFVQFWQKIDDHTRGLPKVKEDEIATIRCEILRRIALFVLDLPYDEKVPIELGLDRLKIGAGTHDGQDDIPLALSAFKVDLTDVRSIDLSHNHLTCCPSWLFGVPPDPTPFPNLVSLDLSASPVLRSIPLRIFRNDLQHLDVEGTQSYQGPDQSSPSTSLCRRTPRPKSIPPVPTTLAHCSIAAMVRANQHRLSDYDIPQHLIGIMNASYYCDLCHTICVPGSPVWLEAHSRRTPNTQLYNYHGVLDRWEGIRVEGRSCRLCLE